MKTMKNLLFLLLGLMIAVLTTNCTDKKAVEKAETTEATAETESVIKVSKPEFKKFVVVTDGDENDKVALLKDADPNSPSLQMWYESDCESDFCEEIYQWSDEPGKSGFELETGGIAYVGKIFPVLGEKGDYYKVATLNKWCLIESAYIHKGTVGDIETAPIKADMLDNHEGGIRSRILKDGKYKDIVLIDNEDELYGETLQVGMLLDGCVATPVTYSFDCQLDNSQNEPIEIKEEGDNFFIKYNGSLCVADDGDSFNQLDPNKLTDEHINQIVGLVTKKEPEFVEYTYHFPAQGLQYFIWKAK